MCDCDGCFVMGLLEEIPYHHALVNHTQLILWVQMIGHTDSGNVGALVLKFHIE